MPVTLLNARIGVPNAPKATGAVLAIRDNPDAKTPVFMGARLYVDLSNDSQFDGKFDELLKAIYGMPAIARPPLGPSPFSSVAPAEASISANSAFELHAQDSSWTDQQASSAMSGLTKLGRTAGMEVRLRLTGTEQWSQLELYDAVKKAQIRTFGWPIGIVLESREEYKPRPRSDGVYAEVPITDKGFSQTTSYDYWALRSDGTFYLLQSLFEDERTTNAVFFNTRIVRIAETLLFGGKLYQSLGLAPERQVIVRISHFGLKGRLLGSSNPNRPLMASNAASDDALATEVPLRLDQMTTNVADSVARFCEPLFMIFDFQRFQRKIYDDIVGRFEAGEVV